MSLNSYTRAQLLALPDRASWQETTDYESLLVLHSKRKHDSGWSCMTVIGVREGVPIEKVTTYSDDASWHFMPPSHRLVGQMRMDCTYPAGVLHFWCSSGQRFHIGSVVSSFSIELK